MPSALRYLEHLGGPVPRAQGRVPRRGDRDALERDNNRKARPLRAAACTCARRGRLLDPAKHPGEGSAGGGAGAGAAIGSASGNAGTGALIGAGVGVVSGALIGDAMQANEQQPVAAPPPPPPPPVVVAPPPPATVSVEINIGRRPALAVVPGTPVYYAPHLSYNYFAYGGRFYVYQHDVWLTARAYNGPWTVIALERIPRPILGVPVAYYKAPPGHWKHKHGPPPWAHAKGHAKHKRHED